MPARRTIHAHTEAILEVIEYSQLSLLEGRFRECTKDLTGLQSRTLSFATWNTGHNH
jgi:hypothetical protein